MKSSYLIECMNSNPRVRHTVMNFFKKSAPKWTKNNANQVLCLLSSCINKFFFCFGGGGGKKGQH